MSGDVYTIPHTAVRVLDGEGWELRLDDPSRVPLGPDEWEAIGGAAVAEEGVGALADEFYGASRGGTTSWVAAVLPGAWPALRIAERSPEPVGTVVVRVRVEVAE